jgi:hypothetical protein
MSIEYSDPSKIEQQKLEQKELDKPKTDKEAKESREIPEFRQVEDLACSLCRS